MKSSVYLLLLALLIPLLWAQPQTAHDSSGTTSLGGEAGGSHRGFASSFLVRPSQLNYSISLAQGENMVLKNRSEHLSTIVVWVQTQDWLPSSYTFRIGADQEMDFRLTKASSPIQAIHVLSMQPFEVAIRDDAPLISASTETVLRAQTPVKGLGLNFIKDASGQAIPVGIMDDGSVNYPLYGKRIGVVENNTVLIDGTQQRFELLNDLDQK